MMNRPSDNTVMFDSPAVYRIRVGGLVPPKWSSRLEDMTITVSRAGAIAPVTTLEGELTDQSSLLGVLNTLYGLHLPVLSVNRLSRRAY